MGDINVEGRELGWDDTIVDDGKDFEPVPEGDYDFTIERFERGRSKGEGKLPACNMATVYFIIHDRDRDVTVRENYLLHSALEWKLSELFRSVGLKKEGESLRMNWPAIPGLTGRARITIEPGLKDPNKKFNRVEKLYPKEAKKFEPGKF